MFAEAEPAAAKNLLAIGDSWQYIGLTHSVGTELAEMGYSVLAQDEGAICENGKTLRSIASQVDELATYVANLDGSAYSPAAILVSGGGNDLTQRNGRDHKATKLFRLLRPGASAPDQVLIADAMQEFIHGELRGYYRVLIDRVSVATAAPILLHGYDRPIPDGRKFAIPFGPGPWLKPVFDCANVAPDLRLRIQVMATLIDDLNRMLASLQREFEGRVHYVGFAGTLEKESGFTDDYRIYWANELHATKRGYQVFATAVRKKLQMLGLA